MKKCVDIAALALCFITFVTGIQAQSVKAEGTSTAPSGFGGGGFGFSTRTIDYKKIEELMKDEKWDESIQLLRSYSTDNDIYFSDFDDAPHHFRSPKRRFLIAQCLMRLGKPDEARKELRSFFEIKADPPYVGMGEVLTLLIDLETTNGYADFEAWLNKHLPAPEKRFYRGSAQQVINIKKDIESGRYDTGYEELRTINMSRLYGEPHLKWQQEAVLSYFRRNPKSLGYLLQKLATGEQSYPDKSIIYCVGEMANPEAIPVLRKLKGRVSNFYILDEIMFALAKSSDKTIIPDLYAGRGYPQLYRKQYINSLLSKLTGISFGEIKNEDDAKRVFEKWKQWIDENTIGKQ
jgi:hypothetical protein